MPDNNHDNGESFGNSSFSSFDHNPWPYVSPTQQHQLERRYFEDGATIHFERLRGLPFWSPLFMFRDDLRVALVIKRVVGASMEARRRLTAEEIDATSEHADNAVRKVAWMHPASVAGALAAAANGRRTFKFPFFQPKMQAFDPYHFPTRAFPIFKGAAAAANWHFVRFLAYCPLTWFASLLFFNSVADMSYRVHLGMDSRLSAMMNDIQSAEKTAQDLARQRQRTQMGLADPPRASQPSPLEGRVDFSDSRVSPVSQSRSFPQSQARGNSTASTTQQSPWSMSQVPASKSGDASSSSYPSENANWGSDPFEDDASPVAPSARRAEGTQQQSSSSGSSWIRLRQQAQSPTGDSSGQEKGWARLRQDKAPNTAERSRGTDQYSYSRQDEEREARNYEKEQAQKEFDALVEAERRGESSSKGRR